MSSAFKTADLGYVLSFVVQLFPSIMGFQLTNRKCNIAMIDRLMCLCELSACYYLGYFMSLSKRVEKACFYTAE